MVFLNSVVDYRDQNLEKHHAPLRWIRKVKARGRIAVLLVNQKAVARAKVKMANHMMTAKEKGVMTLKGVTRGRGDQMFRNMFLDHLLLLRGHLVLPRLG
jgi:hypothetical protein